MERGFVPFWRKSVDSRVFMNAELWHLWSYILFKARSEAGWVSVKTGRGNTEVWLEPGQMIFGRYAVAKKLKQNPSTLYKRLMKLKNLGNCNTKNNTHFTIVTVINWRTYAGHIIPLATRKVTRKEHASNTQVTQRTMITMITMKRRKPLCLNESPVQTVRFLWLAFSGTQ